MEGTVSRGLTNSRVFFINLCVNVIETDSKTVTVEKGVELQNRTRSDRTLS